MTGVLRWGLLASLAVAPVMTVAGCSALRPAVRSVVDVARDLCAMVTSEKAGISPQEAVKTFCATEHQLEPWLDEILQAKRRAAARARGEETSGEKSETK